MSTNPGNFMYATIEASLQLNNSIQNNYNADAQISTDCTNIQTNINNAQTAQLTQDQNYISQFASTGFDALNGQTYKDTDSNYSAAATQLNNQYNNDKATYQSWAQQATSNQNIVADDAQRGSQNIQNAMQMISPILQAMSSFAQTLAS